MGLIFGAGFFEEGVGYMEVFRFHPKSKLMS